MAELAPKPISKPNFEEPVESAWKIIPCFQSRDVRLLHRGAGLRRSCAEHLYPAAAVAAGRGTVWSTVGT
jgi:hypothetical protein